MRCEHVVPLATQVVQLFKDLKLFIGKSNLCFPSPMSNSVPITDVAVLNSLRRIGYGRDEMCIHGFRSMASTLLNEQRYRPDIIEAQLAHKERNSIREAYCGSVTIDWKKDANYVYKFQLGTKIFGYNYYRNDTYDQDFLQKFMNKYSIPELEPRISSGLYYGPYYKYTDNDKGWTIEIYPGAISLMESDKLSQLNLE